MKTAFVLRARASGGRVAGWVRHAAFMAVLFLGGAGTALAEVRLPRIFSDHMVLQADRPVVVWGWAEPNEPVEVQLSGHTQRSVAGRDGRWMVELPALRAGLTTQMVVTGRSNTQTVDDVLVGEVWLASGQSNMEKPFRGQSGQRDVFDAERELAAAQFPQIRLFKVSRKRANAPEPDLVGQWVVTTPKSLDESRFSAVAYVFGRRIHAALDVPVGLIDASWGGTRIEPWTPPEGFAKLPSQARFATVKPGEKLEGADPSRIFNGMVAPLVPLRLRGVLWYQGESNIVESGDFPEALSGYTDKMQALVEGWRGVFGQDLAFYFAQVAPHLYSVMRSQLLTSPELAPQLWEAQADALRIRNTGMVVTMDLVDDLTDIHPRNKVVVGERFANLALASTYGRSHLLAASPQYTGIRWEPGAAIVRFSNTGGDLRARDGKPLSWFQIAGADGRWQPATAVPKGEEVVVSSPRVPQPVAVRFAWNEGALPNLVNRSGLPAAAFRSRREAILSCDCRCGAPAPSSESKP